ncbi:MAG: multicopper oxidase domain-containing protein [Enhygromyxa sp.]
MPKPPRKPLAPDLDRRAFLELCAMAGVSLLPLGGCGDDTASEAGDTGDATEGTGDGDGDGDGDGEGDGDGDGEGDGDGDGEGSDFPLPPIDDGELIDGTRVFRLTLQTGMVEWVAGYPTQTYGVNGPVLGPTLRFRKGERVRLEVTNELGEVSTLHGHGMEVPSASDGGPHQLIAAGETWITEFDVIQRAGTAWYHPHPMHETARQVYMGIAGLIYVEDPAQEIELPSTYGVDDFPLVIQDRRLAADGTHPYSPGNTPAMFDMMAGMRGETLLVNGMREAQGVVPRGLVRLRLLNGSNARAYNLGFEDNRSFQQIASDGGLLEAPLTTNRVLLTPGERAEILVDFGEDPSGATLALRSYSEEVLLRLFQGNAANNMADALDRSTFHIMTLEVGEPPPATITAPDSLMPIERMVEADADASRTIALSMMMGNVMINGAQMTALDAVPEVINFQIPLGTTELWEVTNSSSMAHPLHVHNRHFQVLDVDGQPPPPELAGWKDTVIVEPGQVVRLMIQFEGTPDPDYPYMFHCHILEHEDMGMMGQFFLVEA